MKVFDFFKKREIKTIGEIRTSLTTISKNELSDKLFQKIKKVALVIAKENEIFIKVGMHRYLKHPSQRELIKAFSEYGVTITPYHISEYFNKMEDELMFVNQKRGFIYTQIVKKLDSVGFVDSEDRPLSADFRLMKNKK